MLLKLNSILIFKVFLNIFIILFYSEIYFIIFIELILNLKEFVIKFYNYYFNFVQ